MSEVPLARSQLCVCVWLCVLCGALCGAGSHPHPHARRAVWRCAVTSNSTYTLPPPPHHHVRMHACMHERFDYRQASHALPATPPWRPASGRSFSSAVGVVHARSMPAAPHCYWAVASGHACWWRLGLARAMRLQLLLRGAAGRPPPQGRKASSSAGAEAAQEALYP